MGTGLRPTGGCFARRPGARMVGPAILVCDTRRGRRSWRPTARRVVAPYRVAPSVGAGVLTGPRRVREAAPYVVRISVGAHRVRPRAATWGRPYGDPPPFSLPQSALRLTAPSSEGAKETLPQKSLPLTREVARRKPRRRERPGGHMGPPLHGGGQVAPSSGPAGHLPPRGKVRRVKDAAPYRGCASKSLPLTREVAGRRPDGGRARAATWGRTYKNSSPSILSGASPKNFQFLIINS